MTNLTFLFLLICSPTDKVSAGWQVNLPDTGQYELSIWYPHTTQSIRAAAVNITHQHGSTTSYIDEHFR
jgi:hypothetical protein